MRQPLDTHLGPSEAVLVAAAEEEPALASLACNVSDMRWGANGGKTDARNVDIGFPSAGISKAAHDGIAHLG